MKTKEKTSETETASAVKIPDYKGFIDFEAMDKTLGTTIFAEADYIGMKAEDLEPYISKAEGYIIDQIISQLHLEKKMKKKNYADGNVTWTFKKFECYLAIYLQKGSLSYTVRVNTINFHETNSVLYFSYKNMGFTVESLLYSILRDFTKLIDECSGMEFTPETYIDMLPAGTHRNDSWFCGMHEDLVTRPMHYYDGLIDYEHDRKLLLNDFDSWLDELKTNHGQ